MQIAEVGCYTDYFTTEWHYFPTSVINLINQHSLVQPPRWDRDIDYCSAGCHNPHIVISLNDDIQLLWQNTYTHITTVIVYTN